MGSLRIIPARAGFTTMTSSICSSLGDHPRSRGVYRSIVPAYHRPLGSSPLARGLPGRGPALPAPERIIPARAGFTLMSCGTWVPESDHPRSRGVYGTTSHVSHVSPGSSPLARGLPCAASTTMTSSRIIPARAGFTRQMWSPHVKPKDHPRSRGVYISLGLGSSEAPGSSPLARGLPDDIVEQVVGRGIIPARAGFTHGLALWVGRVWDHPRSRGVYTRSPSLTWSAAGSSPLARGLRAVGFLCPYGERIIPARAGFTDGGVCRARRGRDHPRSRGVYQS